MQRNEKVTDTFSRNPVFMSLNNISLPAQLVTDLYQHALVGGTATAVPQKPPLPFLGKNGRNILVVVHQPTVPYLPDSELSFLTKVLTACQLGLMDVAIVNWSKAPHNDAEAAIEQFKAKAVLLLGMAPSQFGLPANLPLFSVQKNDNTQFVTAPALSEIEKTKEAKQQLWVALKELFDL